MLRARQPWRRSGVTKRAVSASILVGHRAIQVQPVPVARRVRPPTACSCGRASRKLPDLNVASTTSRVGTGPAPQTQLHLAASSASAMDRCAMESVAMSATAQQGCRRVEFAAFPDSEAAHCLCVSAVQNLCRQERLSHVALLVKQRSLPWTVGQRDEWVR